MRVLIKGVGDLASGIALRLHRREFDLVMMDIVVPTTVRRTVVFSPAVYERMTVVEDITEVLCQDQEEIQEVVRAGRTAAVVDDRGDIRNIWKPEVIADAITVKKNLGTAIGDAQTVTDVGPGFMIGVDCYCVVETKRGHNLEWCIWDGSAVPDIGASGMIGGYDEERTIRASAGRIFIGCVSIGDLVEKGRLVGKAGETPIYVEVGGMVRRLLQDGVTVCRGMKSDDVDLRGVVESCFTVSDKASVIGGGVLETILSHTKLI